MRRLAAALLSVGLLSALVGAVPVVTAAAQAPTASRFQAVAPVRVLDTRVSPGTPVGTTAAITLDLSARVPATATAVVLNVTGTEASQPTFVTVYPAGAARPVASNLNLVAGDTRPNLVTVALGSNRSVNLYNHNGSVHLIADLAGFYATDAPGRFTALAPSRVLDTRQTGTPVGGGQTIDLSLANRIPASATAVVLNLTGTNAAAATFVTAWPSGAPRPTASNLNLTQGATAPNLVTVAVGVNRTIKLYNNFGNVDLIADLAGFYTPAYGASFTPVSPSRVLDTRSGPGPVGQGAQIELQLVTAVPGSTTGVVLNITATEPTMSTFVTAWPRLDPRPTASNLNVVPGQTAPNLAAVAVGTLASVSLYNHSGAVHLIADLAGYFWLPDAPCAAECVFAWGSNDSGQLGTGAYSPASANPTPVYGLSGVKDIAGGANRGTALRADGTVWSWGDNSGGQLGADWMGGRSVIPVPVNLPGPATAIGDRVAVVSGQVWTWGGVYPGLGNQPMPVQGLEGAMVDVASTAGTTGYALGADGTVWSWGDNVRGALGRGDASDVPQAKRVFLPTGTYTKIAAGSGGGYALRSDGTLWSWGDNRDSQLGADLPIDPRCDTGDPAAVDCWKTTPVQVAGLDGIVAVGAGPRNGFAVLADGRAFSWGRNDRGALGIGEECAAVCEISKARQVSGLANARAVAGTTFGGYALDASGRVWSWGDNSRGQLGPVTGGGDHSTVARLLSEPTGVTAIAGAQSAGFALR